MERDSEKVPVMTIQCDWEDVLFTRNMKAWVSCKYRGHNSTQGTLTNQGSDVPGSLSEEFTVIACKDNSIQIRHNPSGHKCVFIPALKQFKIHKKGVLSIDVAPGGLGVSVCSGNKLQVWDAESGEVRRLLTGHVGDIYNVKLFPSGVVVLTSAADMQLKIWSAETGQCAATLVGHKAAITDTCIVDRGRNIISVSKDGSARLWDCGKSECLDVLCETSQVINCCAIGVVHQGFTLQPRQKEVNEREIGTNNKLFYTGSEDGVVNGWAVYTKQLLFTIIVDSPINVLLCMSENLIVLGCQDGGILLYNPVCCMEPIRVYHESNSPVLSGCIYKEGFFIGHNDGTVVYYDCSMYSPVRVQLTGPDCDPVYSITQMKDTVYTACRDGTIRKYNVQHVTMFVSNP